MCVYTAFRYLNVKIKRLKNKKKGTWQTLLTNMQTLSKKKILKNWHGGAFGLTVSMQTVPKSSNATVRIISNKKYHNK